MTAPDIAAGWERLENRQQTKRYRHYKPLSDAVDVYVNEARDGERIYFGIPEFDQQIRGVGRGHLCIINGFSHSGKTLLLLHILRHNAHKRTVLFCPDEPAQLTLAKLTSATSGVPADEIEDRIVSGDQQAVELLRHTALVEFPNLIVFDKPLRGEDMEAAAAEAEAVWGEPAELFVLDYLELLQAGETVPQKADFVKAFGSRHNCPFICLHQTSRSAGADGKRMTISSGAYGGEQHATFQLGVWRKKASLAADLIEVTDKMMRAVNGATDQMVERKELLEHELERAEYTLSVAITKNKRPGRREGREEIDFELYGDTGVIVPLAASDLPRQYKALLERRRGEYTASKADVQGYRVESGDDSWRTNELADEYEQEQW